MWLALGVLPALLSGCGEEDPIREYVVARQPSPGTVWFLKLVGPESAVAGVEGTLKAFAESIRFDAETGTPEWTLPAGWQEALPDTQFRYRTVTIPGTPPLEVAVSQVAGQVPLDAADVRNHANLLREQVGLEELPEGAEALNAATAAGEIAPLPVAGQPGRLFRFEGETPKFGATRLLAAMIPSPVPLRVEEPAEAAPSREELPFAYDRPEDWKDAPQTEFSVVSLTVSDGAKTASITITPAMGGVLANVNRWRIQQAGLPGITEADLANSLETIEAEGLSVRYTELIGATRAVLGGIVGEGEDLWFVKLDGPPDLARREREKFRAFLASMKTVD